MAELLTRAGAQERASLSRRVGGSPWRQPLEAGWESQGPKAAQSLGQGEVVSQVIQREPGEGGTLQSPDPDKAESSPILVAGETGRVRTGKSSG